METKDIAFCYYALPWDLCELIWNVAFGPLNHFSGCDVN